MHEFLLGDEIFSLILALLVFGICSTIHTFTTDMSCIVMNHELSFVGTNKKDWPLTTTKE